MVYEYDKWSRLPTRDEGRREYDNGGSSGRGGRDYSKSRWEDRREDSDSYRGRGARDDRDDRRDYGEREISRGRNWDAPPPRQHEQDYSRGSGRSNDDEVENGGWGVLSNAREGERPEVLLPEDLGLPGGFTDKQVITLGWVEQFWLCQDPTTWELKQ
jgi:hypothetical protein